MCVSRYVCLLVRVFEKRSDAMEMTCNEIIMSLTWVFRVGVGRRAWAWHAG